MEDKCQNVLLLLSSSASKSLDLFFVNVNMGPNDSKNFKTLLLLQITATFFKLVLHFPSDGSRKTTLGISLIFSFRFVVFSGEGDGQVTFTLVPYGET